jgi:hypothetical protein
MTLYVTRITAYKTHRLLVVGSMVPNILEYLFLFRRKKAAAFVGRGTKWYHYPSEKAVPARVAKQLEKVSSTKSIYG